MRRGATLGVTLIELIVVLAILGVIVGLAVPRVAGWADRLAVLRAADEVMAFYHRARFAAVFRSTRVRIAFAGDSISATAEGDSDSLLFWMRGPNRSGVALRASRSVIRLYPNGLGLGAANTKLVLRRGAAAESLTVSRLGRLKRWR